MGLLRWLRFKVEEFVKDCLDGVVADWFGFPKYFSSFEGI